MDRTASNALGGDDMDLKRSGSQPSAKGPAANFTGSVRIDPLIQTSDPARVLAVSVTFEPGARTAWHVHPLGQTLIVTAGCGLVQSAGGPIEKIRPGDVVWCPPCEPRSKGETVTAIAPPPPLNPTALPRSRGSPPRYRENRQRSFDHCRTKKRQPCSCAENSRQ